MLVPCPAVGAELGSSWMPKVRFFPAYRVSEGSHDTMDVPTLQMISDGLHVRIFVAETRHDIFSTILYYLMVVTNLTCLCLCSPRLWPKNSECESSSKHEEEF